MRRLAWIVALLVSVVPAFGTVVSSGTAEQKLLEHCLRRPVDVDALLSDVVVRGSGELKNMPFAAAQDLLFYGACRTLQGGANGCSQLRGLVINLKDGDLQCREFASLALMARLIIRGGDGIGACCSARLGSNTPCGSSVKKGCSALVAAVRAGDPPAACPALEAGGFSPDGESCRRELLYWGGKPQACVSIKDSGKDSGADVAGRRCREAAALVAGLLDEGLCADSPHCQSLKGASVACEPLRRASESALCDRVRRAATEWRAEQQKNDRQRAQALNQAEEKRKAALQKKIEGRRAALKVPVVKPQFQKGEAMQKPMSVSEKMKRLEKGLPLPKPDASGGSDARRKKK